MKNSEDGAEAIRNIPVIGDAIMRTDVNIWYFCCYYRRYLYWLAAYAHQGWL